MIVTIYDTETTGLFYSGLLDNEKKPEMTEFCAFKVDLDKEEILKEYEFLVKPKRGIPDEAVAITGITNEMVENEKHLVHYVDQIKDALEKCDAVVAHNLSYDKEMIDTEMARINHSIKWPRLICTVEKSICIKGYRLSLTELHRELFNEAFSGAHRARKDVEALMRCTIELYKRDYI